MIAFNNSAVEKRYAYRPELSWHSCGLVRKSRKKCGLLLTFAFHLCSLKLEEAAVMSIRITVLLEEDVDAEFTAFCQSRGFKKSTLVARLIREHLVQEGSPVLSSAFGSNSKRQSAQKKGSVQ